MGLSVIRPSQQLELPFSLQESQVSMLRCASCHIGFVLSILVMIVFLTNYPYQEQIASNKGSIVLPLILMALGLLIQIRQTKKLETRVNQFTAEQVELAKEEERKHRSLNDNVEQLADDLTSIGSTAEHHLASQKELLDVMQSIAASVEQEAEQISMIAENADRTQTDVLDMQVETKSMVSEAAELRTNSDEIVGLMRNVHAGMEEVEQLLNELNGSFGALTHNIERTNNLSEIHRDNYLLRRIYWH